MPIDNYYLFNYIYNHKLYFLFYHIFNNLNPNIMPNIFCCYRRKYFRDYEDLRKICKRRYSPFIKY